MGKLLCEKNVRDVWCRNESVRAEIGPIDLSHTSAILDLKRGSVGYRVVTTQPGYGLLLCFPSAKAYIGVFI